MKRNVEKEKLAIIIQRKVVYRRFRISGPGQYFVIRN